MQSSINSSTQLKHGDTACHTDGTFILVTTVRPTAIGGIRLDQNLKLVCIDDRPAIRVCLKENLIGIKQVAA